MTPIPYSLAVGRRLFRSLLILGLLCAVVARATIDLTLQMQLGNPTSATADPANHLHYLIQRAQYAFDYNDTTRQTNWTSWDLTTGDLGSAPRSNFIVDNTLPAGFYQVLTTDYSGSGFDRGHMCPSGDRTVTVADNQVTFYMSNMIPQAPDNNQGVWANFESECRTLANAGNEILITSGPSLFGGATIASGVAIADFTWKIAVVVPNGSGSALSRITTATRVIALKIPNTAGVRTTPWQNFVTSAAAIEADTGFTFFTALPASIANVLRAKVDGQAGTPPTITTQPVSQSVGAGATVTFTVAASGTAPFSYQWRKAGANLADGGVVSGATAATLTLTGVQPGDAGGYDVIVSNADGSATSTVATLTVGGGGPTPPSITTQPVSQSVSPGANVTFTVAASGTAPLTYQWRKGGVNLTDGGVVSGATTATLALTGVQTGDAGSYDVVVTNSAGSATSATATLTVQTGASATIAWNFNTADPSSGLPADVTGGTVAQGNNNGTTTLLTTTSASSGYTGATGGNNAGAAARTGALNKAAGGSAYFTLTLTPAAGKRLQITGLNFGARSTSTGPQAFAVFSSVDNFTTAIASGTVASDSVWRLISPTTTTTTGSIGTAITLRIYGYNGTGSASANTANWRIDDLSVMVKTTTPPSITTQPVSQSVSAGANVTFTVAASGTAPLTYQWRKGGVNLADGGIVSGSTTATLALTGVQTGDAGSYDVVVTNSDGSATSAAATLTVQTTQVSSTITWNFNAADPSSGLPADVTGGTVAQGNNNGTTTLLTTTSASSGYTGATGGNNAGAAARTGALNKAAGGSAYFTLTLTPAAGKRLQITGLNFGERSTSTGPQAFAVFSSVDNFTTAIASGTVANDSVWRLISPTTSTTTGTTGTAITLRIYGYNGTGSASANTANWRIDDLKITVNTQ